MGMPAEVEQQLAVMEQNVDTLLPRDDLARRIERSLRQERPLRA